MITTLLLALALDAPPPAARQRAPRPSPSPIVVPFDLVPTDPPEALPEAPAAPEPTPSPSPSPAAVEEANSIEEANSRGFHFDSQLGALGTITAADGTEASPFFWVNTDGPIAIGSRSIGRLGARIGLTTAPGATFSITDVTTYNAVEADFWGGYVVGAFSGVETTVFLEGGFASRMKGASDPPPLRRLSRSAGAGIRFDARESSAYVAVKGGFDEATTNCKPAPGRDCSGFHAGFALMLRGQVPIYKDSVLLTGDVSLSIGGSTSWLQRVDILRLGFALDPIASLKRLHP